MCVGGAGAFTTGRLSRGFRFSLEPLLLQRKAIENVRLATLARAQARLEQAHAHLARLELEFAGAFAEIPRGGSALLAELERAVTAAQTAVARCVAETDEVRVPLLEAVANRKAIEALKKRRLAEYDAREARKEERELDEANLG